MTAREDPPDPEAHDPLEDRIRRAWLVQLAPLGVLLLGVAIDAAVNGWTGGDLFVGTLLLLSVGGAAIHRREVAALERRRRGEVEAYARIVRGLSRSESPDAIVGAIVHELAASTGADHVVVAHLHRGGTLLDAALFTASGAGSTSVAVPFGERDDGHAERRRAPAARRPAHPGARTERLAARQVAADRMADRIALRAGAAFGLKNLLSAPLVTNTGVVGAVVVSRRATSPWPGAARRLVAAAAVEASAAFVRAQAKRAAEREAATDPLTGLPNRRYFEEVAGLFGRRRQGDGPVGVLMIDIDHFKALNDRFGHAAGDEVLRDVADAIVGAIREDDVPARYGGEEFVVLLRDASHDTVRVVGERVRQAVRAADLGRLGIEGVSVSVGAAVAEGDAAGSGTPTVAALLELADRRLYAAKRDGRDRVVAE